MESHDRYRHLRDNLDRTRAATGFRTVKVFCEVCQVFEPDDSGRCPLCQPDPVRDLPLDVVVTDAPVGEPLQPPAQEDGAA